ncbi:MAG: copper resistance protein CopC [Pseudohongiellaceae bacterium]
MLNRMTVSTAKAAALAGLLMLGFAACSSTAGDYSPLLDSEPAAGAELTRTPRTLRLFYAALPDVSKSSLKLVGPSGEHALRGMHTMGADDLMIEILDPVTPGSYTVQWTAVVGDDPNEYQGSYTFSVQP